jgi:hypothetical protein
MIKNLYILWFQGFDQAPEIVQACVQSWIEQNPTWTVHLLDDTTWPSMVSLDGIQRSSLGISRTNFSDLVRIALLDQRGGCWVDATTFCTQPLDEWLPACIEQGFFAFDRPAKDLMLSSWFLYAEPGNYIVKKWCQATMDYYLAKPKDKKQPYYNFHYLFADLYKTDTRFRRMWDAVPKRSADGPHQLQKSLFKPMDDSIRQRMQEQPLSKLTYKGDFRNYSEDSVLAHLVSFSPYKKTTMEGFQTPGWVYSSGITLWPGGTILEVLLILLTCLVLGAAVVASGITGLSSDSANPFGSPGSKGSPGSNSSPEFFGSANPFSKSLQGGSRKYNRKRK